MSYVRARDGVDGVAARGSASLYAGAAGAAGATLAGHYPWFACNNALERRVPDFGADRKHARRALIGFACSLVADTLTNALRVVKVRVQTSAEPVGYGAAAAAVVTERGVVGLLTAGLPAKLLSNGISSIVFSVVWKTLMERRARRSPRRSPRRRGSDPAVADAA